MSTMRRIHLLPALLSLLAACASGPTFDTSRVEQALTPRQVAAHWQDATGKRILWGGVILAITNLEQRTDIEVLAYPLDADNRPRRDDDPLGRFIIEQAGYLEPASYSEGRLVTVAGTVSRAEPGKIGASDYAYPVISAQQLYLWPRDGGYDGTSVHFGIGVGIGF